MNGVRAPSKSSASTRPAPEPSTEIEAVHIAQDRGDYITAKLLLHRSFRARLATFEKILAVFLAHAADPTLDDEERRLAAEAIPATRTYVEQARARIASLNNL